MSPTHDPDDFPRILDHLLEGHYLTGKEAEAIMDRVLGGELGPERLAALVTAIRAKSPHEDEIVGFARSMRRHGVRIQADPAPGTPRDGVVFDNCGTGGASVKTFNISTITAFVIAAAGVTVAKHGNRSVTRPSGSADILEAAGAKLDLTPDAVEQVLRQAGIAFLFAPTFHPAMRHAGPVRQALGIKTVFNLLGPLTNPAGATHQVLGVYDPTYVPLIARALARLGCKEGYVLHGEPGTDEATPCGPVHFVRIQDGVAGEEETIDPRDLGVPRCDPADIAPVPASEAPAVLRALLDGTDTGPRREAIALNAAFALVATGKAPDLLTGVEMARDLLASGAGSAKWDAFVAATQAPPTAVAQGTP